MSFVDLDLDLGELGGNISWSEPLLVRRAGELGKNSEAAVKKHQGACKSIFVGTDKHMSQQEHTRNNTTNCHCRNQQRILC